MSLTDEPVILDPAQGAAGFGDLPTLAPVAVGVLRLADGDRAAAFNDRGRITLTVQVTDRLRPGLASIAWGWVRDAYGGVPANALTNDATTDLGGGAAYGDTLVQVEASPS